MATLAAFFELHALPRTSQLAAGILNDSERQNSWSPSSPDRRVGIRYPSDEAVLCSQINPFIPGRLAAVVCDVSRDGMRLKVPKYLMPGTLVQIRFQRLIATAEVRHCRRKGADFFAGLRISEILSRTGRAEELV